ncbi:hypothetical protein CGRA01v4_12437 [Colletotrichum graminicola]|uniref:Uncharacterized protein n=1 Tax=Colletotrichum graminicola (strain M1.001 / M2 / FGSC 10212) TaxID=645133 RepID=E3QSW8_COLGM|nr:uncharacterized protein GLRG_09100 [Colletotrichum graminicola M1.001]EFQ33956.1 hypothetical protein GLRG_09100 [Colletotrichum graminicola M1.001]WDK21148.1 hypothetical protein CGRA01v4_12437 [Colletotrichum graminicola]
MPELEEVSYSREECIAAIRDYYTFLTKMYLKEEDVLHSPEGGWPSITPETMAGLDKSDEVISLLRHLPYLRRRYDENDPQGAAYCCFANWQTDCYFVEHGQATNEEFKLVTEGADIYEDVPPHVISLTSGGLNCPSFLLDTELGIVYWRDCPGEIRTKATHEQVWDDPYEWAPENEAEWRGDAAHWAVKDSFETLKDQFITLSFIPTDSETVRDIYTVAVRNLPCDGWIERVQAIYRNHGWPDLEKFRKEECLKVIKTALREEFPQL